MGRDQRTFDDINVMADEVSRLMISRLGGARRGEQPPLHVMVRRRGGALPRKLRKQAAILGEIDRISAQPKIARQQDMDAVTRSHAALMHYLQPLGEISRFQGRAISVAASLAFGLLLLGAIIVWIMVKRGTL